MPKVTLYPENNTLEVSPEKDLLTALREQNIYVKSSCGGHATCRDCMIKVVGGEDKLSPPTFGEIKLLGNVFHITKERLACQTKISGDVVIDLTAHDKSRDETDLKNKTNKLFSQKIKLKKPNQQRRSLVDELAHAKRDRPERQGGNRRPRPFKDHDDSFKENHQKDNFRDNNRNNKDKK
jgi:2Fe-2S ferredoxin